MIIGRISKLVDAFLRYLEPRRWFEFHTCQAWNLFDLYRCCHSRFLFFFCYERLTISGPGNAIEMKVATGFLRV